MGPTLGRVDPAGEVSGLSERVGLPTVDHRRLPCPRNTSAPASTGPWVVVLVLLAPAVVLPLLPGIYARSRTPRSWTFPFFFWFQFALIIAVHGPHLAGLPGGVARGPRAGRASPAGPPAGDARTGRTDVDGIAVSVFVFFFLLVTVLGFAAARWRRAAALDNLDEWGLGGRGFGSFIAWFLIGGDLYTAYTFIAVPATLYAGSAVGFFAVPYTIVVYPIIFLFLPRLWSVSHRHGYVTPADFVEGRYDSRPLALAVAITGLLATMPYIALQLVGIEVILQVLGLQSGEDTSWWLQHLPLFIAFGRARGVHLLLRAASLRPHRVRQGRA